MKRTIGYFMLVAYIIFFLWFIVWAKSEHPDPAVILQDGDYIQDHGKIYQVVHGGHYARVASLEE